MSHGSSSVSIQDVSKIVEAEPFKLPTVTKIFLWGLVILSVVIFVRGAISSDPRQVWIPLQINFIYWLCVTAAASCFSAVFQICNAQWARPIRRLFESASYFFSFSWIILIVLYFGREHLFEWSQHPVHGKEFWLSSKFLYARDIIGLLILSALARKTIYYTLRQDLGAIRSGVTGIDQNKLLRWTGGAYEKFVKGWGSDTKQELQQVKNKLGRLSPVVVITYSLVMSLIAFDQVMSVDAHWYSTLFGAFIFMGAVYLSVAWTSIGIGLIRELHPIFLSKIERRTLHDLGKLLFGFGIFWAYLFWSHYLPIWYGNMPEETAWVITRLREEPWHNLAWVILGSCFFIPFFLGLNRDLKQVPSLLFLTGCIVACGMWLQHYILFVPTLSPNNIPLTLNDVAITFGFFAAFILSAAAFLKKYPLIPFGDLYLKL